MIRVNCYPTTGNLIGNAIGQVAKAVLFGIAGGALETVILEIENELVTLKCKSKEFGKEYEILKEIEVKDIVDAKVITEDKKKFLVFTVSNEDYWFGLDSDLTKQHEKILVDAFKVNKE